MKILSKNPEVTFDDVLLLPNYSDFSESDEHLVCNTTSQVTKKRTLAVPIIASPMRGVTEYQMAITLGKLGGLGVIHAFLSKKERLAQATKVKKAGVMVAVAISTIDDETIDFCLKLEKIGVDIVSIETAHANNKKIIAFIKKLKKKLTTMEVSVAHVVDANAVRNVAKAGADSIRVGIGGGSHCTTRLATGIGRPQLSALEDCCKEAKKWKVPIISDTGIKYPGDVAKALGFGASAVMIGGLFAATSDSPGEMIVVKGQSYKPSQGNCNISQLKYKTRILDSVKGIVKTIIGRKTHPEPIIFQEGVGKLLKFKGETDEAFNQLKNGLVRSMAYTGTKDIKELQKKARFIITSSNTVQENIPRI